MTPYSKSMKIQRNSRNNARHHSLLISLPFCEHEHVYENICHNLHVQPQHKLVFKLTHYLNLSRHKIAYFRLISPYVNLNNKENFMWYVDVVCNFVSDILV